MPADFTKVVDGEDHASSSRDDGQTKSQSNNAHEVDTSKHSYVESYIASASTYYNSMNPKEDLTEESQKSADINMTLSEDGKKWLQSGEISAKV